MSFYDWRLRISLQAARDKTEKTGRRKPDYDALIARWREAMAFERRAAWPRGGDPIPLRVPTERLRR